MKSLILPDPFLSFARNAAGPADTDLAGKSGHMAEVPVSTLPA